MKRYIIVTMLLFYSGCHASELHLTDNSDENNKIIKQVLPSGTPALDSITKMENEGFKCNIERNAKPVLHKGNIEIGQIGPLDLVVCVKQEQAIVARKWQVILILDKQDKVKDHTVTSGLVGP